MANRENMAVEGSFQHMLTDLYAFIGTLVAAIVILATGFDRADPIASLAVAALMLYSRTGCCSDSTRVLLEGAPKGMDVTAIGTALAEYPRVAEVHDLHVWEIGTAFPALSAHVLVRPGDDCHAVRRELEVMLDDASTSSTRRSRWSTRRAPGSCRSGGRRTSGREGLGSARPPRRGRRAEADSRASRAPGRSAGRTRRGVVPLAWSVGL